MWCLLPRRLTLLRAPAVTSVSSLQIQNLVLSCAANAKQQGMKKSKLFISEVMADQVWERSSSASGRPPPHRSSCPVWPRISHPSLGVRRID